MRRKKRRSDIAVYKFLRTFCNVIFSLSLILFIFLFFYKDIKPILQDIEKSFSGIKLPALVGDKKNPSFQKIQNKELLEDKKNPEHEKYQKILLAYDLRDNLLVSRLIVEFLSEFADSNYANKVRLIGVQMMNDREDFNGADRYIRKVISSKDLDEKDYLQAVILLGETAYKSKKYDPYIQSVLEQGFFRAGDAEKSKISFYLGHQMLYKGDLHEALRYFNNVSGEEGVLGRSEVYVAKNMIPEAILVLENFLESYPNSTNYQYAANIFAKQNLLYAQMCSEKGYLNEAESAYKKITRYFPGTVLADEARLKWADVLYRQGSKEESLEKLKEILENENRSKQAEALFIMGSINFEIGNQKEALKNFRMILEDFSDSIYIEKSKEWIKLISESIRYT